MLSRSIRRVVLGTAFFLGIIGVTMAAPAPYVPLHGNPDGTYRIDPQHTNVFFTIGHVGIAPFTGRFDAVSGTYTFDEQDPRRDRVDISIPAASINTNFALRNQDLRGAAFFYVKKYPKITFIGRKFVPTGKDTGRLYGELSLRGVTRPVVFKVREIGAGEVGYLPKPWGGYLSGFVATTTIHRSEFGMDAYLPEGLSNVVRIKVEVEGVKQG